MEMRKGLVIILIILALIINLIGIVYVLNYYEGHEDDEMRTNFRTIHEPVLSGDSIDLIDKTSTKTIEVITDSKSTTLGGSNEEPSKDSKPPYWAEIDSVTPTHSWMNVYGDIYIKDKPAAIGDKIACFNSQEELIGIFEIKETGKFGFMHIYRDDITTGNKDGASLGEELVFRIYDKSRKEVFGLEESEDVYYSDFSKIRLELDGD
ncbi:hypothetical protein GOV12_02170 [Candidatus Pacearchaeota archaeon]|nr:hypothetical protein [Candidatus Pacearchaeota archaeon]